MAIDPKSAVAMFTFAKDTINGLFSEKVDERVKEKLREILNTIDNLQNSALEKNETMFAMQHELYELKDKLRNIEDWKSKFVNYELVTTPGKGVVYKFNGNPSHYICPACVVKKEIQILQDNDSMSGEFTCPGCKSQFSVNVAEYLDPM
jgi:hypothetical protein